MLSTLLSAACASTVAFGQDAEDVQAPRVRVERPPEGSWRRGALPVPDWVAYAAGAVVVGAAAAALVWRAKR